VFNSGATNLIDGTTTSSVGNVYLHDRVTGVTELVSVTTGGSPTSNSYHSSVSADGSKVAFASNASNLVTGDTNTKADIFVRDRTTGTTARVSTDSDGGQSDGASAFPKISANGAYVAYHSDATDLVPGDTEGKRDVFLWSEGSHSVVRVSQGLTDAGGDAASVVPAISADGRYVVYPSDANNLVAVDTNGLTDVFRWDRNTGLNELVSLSPAGLQGSPADCWSPTVSADGRYVAFGARGFPVGPGDTPSSFDIFVRDTVAGTTRRVSQTPAGTNGNGESWVPVISGNGTTVAFTTQATNLGGTDTNGTYDLYARDLTR
jgi:Tol biopolymer transport system component